MGPPRGIDLKDFGPEVDPCQLIPALAKAKATAEFDKGMGISSKAQGNTTTTTSTHTTTTRTTADAYGKCSGAGQDCTSTKCCSLPGMQCYKKSKDWAQCRETCVPGKDPTDVDSVPQ